MIRLGMTGNANRAETCRQVLLFLAIIFLAGCGTKPAPQPVPAPFTESPAEPDPVPIVDQPDMEPVEEIIPPVQIVYRPNDTRPDHDDARAKELGIERYESRRLVLYSDLPPETARTLPPLVDALYPHWTEYFGELPPDREGKDYQLTGYVIVEADRFRAAGMLPDELPVFAHGRHRGREFWLFNQEFPYYREHLVLHEATHCYMTTMPGPLAGYWYMEGMAEYFALHAHSANSELSFSAIPDDPAIVRGFGALHLIQQELDADQAKTVKQVMQLGQQEFAQNPTLPYAWSWWLCHFLSQHPSYSEDFRKLGQHLGSQQFFTEAENLYADQLPLLEAEWSLATHDLSYGFDVGQFAIGYHTAESLTPGTHRLAEVHADSSWQCTQVAVQEGDRLRITASGRVVLATVPRPWESEAQGISIKYASGKPIGRLLGVVLPSVGKDGKPLTRVDHPEILDIGPDTTVNMPASGTLYLRVNDLWSERRDNSGSYQIEISTGK